MVSNMLSANVECKENGKNGESAAMRGGSYSSAKGLLCLRRAEVFVRPRAKFIQSAGRRQRYRWAAWKGGNTNEFRIFKKHSKRKASCQCTKMYEDR
jgi:hypothetical protein